MNMLNNFRLKYVLFCILAGCIMFAGLELDAQSSKKKKSAKNEIPEEVLLSPYGKPYIDQKIQNFTDWITAGYKPTFEGRTVVKKDPHAKAPSEEEIKRLKKEAKKAGRKYQAPKAPEIKYELSRDRYRREMLSLKMLFSKPENLDDIEESTGVRREWYLALLKEAADIEKPITMLERAYEAGNEEYYEELFKNFEKAVNEFKKKADKKDELSTNEMKRLTEKNQARRKAEYLKRLKEKNAAENAKGKGADK